MQRIEGPQGQRVQATSKTARDAVLWLGIYLLAVTAPLFALLPGVSSPGRGLVWDFAMALGYAGVAMLGVQFEGIRAGLARMHCCNPNPE